MPVPTHSDNCLTNIHRTSCPDCNDEVWFFRCNCGSMVFFESPGKPWTPHRCRKYEIKEAIDLIKNAERLTDRELYKLIEQHEKKHNTAVEPEIMEILEYELGKRTIPFTIQKIECTEEINVITGKIMNINCNINFEKLFKIPKNSPLASSFLKTLSSNTYNELTVRENPNKKNCSREYKVYIKKRDSKGIQKNQTALAYLSVYELPAKGKIWLVEKIEIY